MKPHCSRTLNITKFTNHLCFPILIPDFKTKAYISIYTSKYGNYILYHLNYLHKLCKNKTHKHQSSNLHVKTEFKKKNTHLPTPQISPKKTSSPKQLVEIRNLLCSKSCRMPPILPTKVSERQRAEAERKPSPRGSTFLGGDSNRLWKNHKQRKPYCNIYENKDTQR